MNYNNNQSVRIKVVPTSSCSLSRPLARSHPPIALSSCSPTAPCLCSLPLPSFCFALAR